MKPPKKVTKPNTPDNPNSPDDGAPPRREIPDIGLPGRLPEIPGAEGPSTSRPTEGESDNVPRQPQLEVADIPLSGQFVSNTGTRTGFSFLPDFLARDLPAADLDGLRYGKRQTIYAEIENEGITLVRLGADGEYRAALLTELVASGPVLERIGNTPFWRRKVVDEQAGPSASKRPRVDESADSSSGEAARVSDQLAQHLAPLDLSAAQWRNWGSSTRPLASESLEINGLHYPLVPNGSPQSHSIAYLQHPRFSPARYEAFEQMLHDEPTLQPRWALKRDGQWQVLEDRFPFNRPLTGYVANSYRDLSQTSLTTVARSLFNRANHSEVIDSRGLAVLKQTLRNWADNTSASIPRLELADPLLMLPIIPRTRSANNVWMTLLPADANAALRRLDFTPEGFAAQWNNFVIDPSNYNLKQLLIAVLVRNGYDVFPMSSDHRGPTLVFTRANHDRVFFLKLGNVNGETIRQMAPSGDELSDPHLVSRIGEAAHERLRTAYDQNRVVWLLGGVQTTSSGVGSVFIVREG
ncbi:hypothetical protein [Pseudomonas sp. SDO55104_S430]